MVQVSRCMSVTSLSKKTRRSKSVCTCFVPQNKLVLYVRVLNPIRPNERIKKFNRKRWA